MTTDTEVREKGIKALIGALGPADAGRFLSLLDRQPIDYTHWRHLLFEGMTLEEIHNQASKLWQETHKEEIAS